MPSEFELVTFAYDVYRDKVRPPLPARWRQYLDFQPNKGDCGYFGACYIASITNPITGEELFLSAVIAHRGTVISFADIIQDIEIAMGHIPGQFAVAKQFTDEVMSKIADEFSRSLDDVSYLVSHTGHSLGAILSQAVGTATVPDDFVEMPLTRKVLGVESPGAMPIIRQLVQSGDIASNKLPYLENIDVIQVGYNIINTCNQQVNNQVAYLDIIPDETDTQYYDHIPPFISKDFFLNTYYLESFTRIEHSIARIYLHFQSTSSYLTDFRVWPAGFQAGYDAYRSTQRGDTYWHYYIEMCWQENPQLEKPFPSFAEYRDFFIKHCLNPDDPVVLVKTNPVNTACSTTPIKKGDEAVMPERAPAWLRLFCCCNDVPETDVVNQSCRLS